MRVIYTVLMIGFCASNFGMYREYKEEQHRLWEEQFDEQVLLDIKRRVLADCEVQQVEPSPARRHKKYEKLTRKKYKK